MNDIDHYYNQLKELNPYQMYRIRCLINKKLDDPDLNAGLKSKFHVGQHLRYFENETNRLIEIVILKVMRTNLDVREVESGKRWTMPFYMIHDEEKGFRETVAPQGPKVDPMNLKVGDSVSFLDNEGKMVYGKITKLNPKRAKVVLNCGARWNVYYSSLHKVIDVEVASKKLSLPDVVVIQ